MSHNDFEYEERYRVNDPQATIATLQAAGFEQTGTQAQTDHWYIPNRIMSSDQQSHWFDHEAGYALRIREETSASGMRTTITGKQLVNPGDHSAMTNIEGDFTVPETCRILSAIGPEFEQAVATLRDYDSAQPFTVAHAKQLIEAAGRKEYITIHKERQTFRHPAMHDIVIDLDSIPALADSELGFSASLEIEYTGTGTLEEARLAVRSVSSRLGYKPEDILAKALPGLAIPYLAQF